MKSESYCIECMELVPYEMRKVKVTKNIRDKEYEFDIHQAFCEKCGSKIHVHGLDDLRVKEIDAQYRQYENIVSMEDIEHLMKIYGIGKGPLSLSLGFGEVTIKRYMAGVVPSKEYSDIIRKALESPQFMKILLEKNKDKMKETAYSKAMAVAQQLCQTMDMSETLLSTISYIFYKLEEVTPSTLQNLLFISQAFYMNKYNTPLFPEDCVAGPIYEKVYQLFKLFGYHVIEDKYYAIIKNNYKHLSNQQLEILDLVLDTYGMFNGKILEKIIYQEETWKPTNTLDQSNEIIEKESMKQYYHKLSQHNDLTTKDGILRYIFSLM